MKTKTRFRFRCLPMAAILLLLFAQPTLADTWYVKGNATGTNNGTSWTNAFTALQTAIDAAQAGDEIWVAGGTYVPTLVVNGASARNRTFYIDQDVRLFGGFAGTPGTEGDFNSRDIASNPTILSGDIGVPGDPADNVFHVVYFDHVSDNTLLDGFAIRDGFGVNGNGLENTGAGVYNDGSGGVSNPVFNHCLFDNNQCSESGGAFANIASEGEGKPAFFNCTFSNNTASGGGAVASVANPNGEGSPIFVNCAFKGNSAPTAGGGAVSSIAVSFGECSPQYYNCLFSGNSSPTSGALHTFANANGVAEALIVNCTFAGNNPGAVSLSAIGESDCSAHLENCILWDNGGGTGISANGGTITAQHCIIPFGFAGTGNLSDNPLLVSIPDFNDAPTASGDLHLQLGSPAIDAGNNDALPDNLLTDLDGQPRYINPNTGTAGLIDMGAFEFQGASATGDPAVSALWQLYPNPVSDRAFIALASGIAPLRLVVTDLQGKSVWEIFPQGNASLIVLPTERLSAGVYVVSVYTPQRISSGMMEVIRQ